MKVKEGKEESTRTKINPLDKEDLMIPDEMWEYISSRKGWVPITGK